MRVKRFATHKTSQPAIFYGAHVRAGTYSERTNHYGILRTVEDMYGLAHAGASAKATPITDVWK